MLHLKDISYHYRSSNWRLRIECLTINAGEILGIIGPNGSGKSTLLRIAAGLLRSQQGDVFLENMNILDVPRRHLAGKIAFLPQRVVGDFEGTVFDVVSLGRFPHQRGIGFLCEHDLLVIDKVLREIGLEKLRNKHFRELSGGEQQRVMLASVLTQEPDLLLLDEPTSALDPHHAVRFFRLLRQIVRQGPGIAVVTHDNNAAAVFCDRLLLLCDGHSVVLGKPCEVLTETIVRQLYGDSVILDRHPLGDFPVLLPTPDSQSSLPSRVGPSTTSPTVGTENER